MPGRISLTKGGVALVAAIALLAPVSAQSRPETYAATASVKTAGGASLSAPVTVAITSWTSDAERKRLSGILKSGGSAALQKALDSAKPVGTVTLGTSRYDAKYAYAMGSSEGRIISLVTAKPMFFVGAGAPSAKPKSGHILGVVTIEVNASGTGKGTITPAAAVKMSTSNAIVVEDYSAELVTLPDVKKK